MIELNRTYITHFSLLLITLQIAIIIYVTGLGIISLPDLYGILFSYSILLASVPIIFGFFILVSKNLPFLFNYVPNNTNGYMNSSNGNGNGKDHLSEGLSSEGSLPIYLFFLGAIIILYNVGLMLIRPPFFMSLIIPLVFFLFIMKQYKSNSLYF